MVIGVPIPKTMEVSEQIQECQFGPFDEETRQWQRTLVHV